MQRRARTLRLWLIVAALIAPTAAHRAWLSVNPYTNFDPFGYNVPHLFTGVLLMTIGGVPLMMASVRGRAHLLASVVFAVGLSLAMDEWVYLIATEGTDDQYLLPVSWWGAAVMVAVSIVYAVAWHLAGRPRRSRAS